MISIVPLGLLAMSCATMTPLPGDEAARQRMLALLLPRRIEIVEPFTRVKSFDDDGTPDGIELLLQAVNSLDDPGLMVIGTLRVELYEYVPASGLPRGRRLEQWDVELVSDDQQRKYWNQLTQMYELRLGVDPKRIPSADRYVLLVTYDSPFGDRLTDEYMIQSRASTSEPRGGLSRKAASN